MSFSVLSWNVEHFSGEAARMPAVVSHIRSQDPDVFGLLEVENLDAYHLIETDFPDYDFGITDGPERMEILVGWRRTSFTQVTFSQKREFRLYSPYLRPGGLLTARATGSLFYMLFLHTDSGTTGKDFGNRFEMFEKIWALKKALDKHEGGPDRARLAILGDLNTMGLFYPTRRKAHQRISQTEEIDSLGGFAKKADLRVLPKDHGATWTDGKRSSDLDHIMVSGMVRVQPLVDVVGAPILAPSGRQAEVSVRGWVQLAGQPRADFIESISDHSSVFATIG